MDAGMVLIITGIASVALLAALYVYNTLNLPKRIKEIEKLLEREQYNTAISLVRNLIAKKSNETIGPKLHYLMGRAYQGTKNYSMALEEYKAALRDGRKEPGEFKIMVKREVAEILDELGRSQEALQVLASIIKLDPLDHMSYFKIGRICYEHNDLKNAIKYLTSAAEIDLKDFDTLYYLGLSNYFGARMNEAYRVFRLALNQEPRNTNIRYYIGKIYKSRRDFLRAIDEFSAVLKEGVEFRRESFFEKSVCYIQIGEASKAMVDLENGLRLPQPGDELTLLMRYTLASIYEELGDVSRAIEQWHAIAKVKKDYKDVHEKLELFDSVGSDESLMAYLSAPEDEFEIMTSKMLTVLQLKSVSSHYAQNGDIVIKTQQEDDAGFAAANLALVSVRISRNTEKKVGEREIRELIEYSRENKIPRSIFMTCGKFSDRARHFAASRPVDLYDATRLASLVSKAQELSY